MKRSLRIGFAARLAARETRSSWRKLGLTTASIALGVAALVSIHSFREDFARSIQSEAEVLMGANARLSSDRPLEPPIEAITDSLSSADIPMARVTTVSSMVLAPGSGAVRLLQVRALDPGYPFYGTPTTAPEGLWGIHLEAGQALVDVAVLTQLDIEIGDTLVVGRDTLAIRGTVEDLPTDVAFQTAIGPRLHVSHETLERAGLIAFGSLARYEVYLRLVEIEARRAIRERYADVLEANDTNLSLAEEQAQSISNGVRFLGRFLALVGLAALLLGGVGVGSAIHVYIRERRASIAVLRCLGASQGTAFLAYLLQAITLGFVGAASGVVLGLALQEVMPTLLQSVLPVEMTTRLSPWSIAAGFGIGVWVALVFALLPLLRVRDVPPLAALREAYEPARRSRLPYLLAWIILAGSVIALCTLEAPEPSIGLAFAAGLGTAAAAVGGIAWGLMRVTKRFFPRSAPYTVRQGVANLFRPQNQTMAVTLALGLGAFVIGTIAQIESNLREDLTVSVSEGQPNLLLFDLQLDQIEGVRELIGPQGDPDASPLVTARVSHINGVDVDQLRELTDRSRRPEGWAVRREYRNTYRAELGRAETLTRGRWWDDTPGTEDGTRIDIGDLPGLSLEEDVAQSLRVDLGDTISWDVSGRRVDVVVTSLRRVEWNRLEPNFFAIFEPGILDDAPQNALMVARIPSEEERARVQRSLVGAYPNVSVLDFSRVQEALETILTRVRQAVAFLGGFCALAGLVVLAGALSTSRSQRVREGALLKTLGARRHQVLKVLFSEYLVLGTVATAGGLALAGIAARLMLPGLFELDFTLRVQPMVAIWCSVVLLTVLTGLFGSRDLLTRPPLPVLREAAE